MSHSLARDFDSFMGNVIWAQKKYEGKKYMEKIHYINDKYFSSNQVLKKFEKAVCRVAQFGWFSQSEEIERNL